MAKNREDQQEDIEVRPKWEKPDDFKKAEQPDQKQEWVNPNRMTSRERMDLRLERAGLLNYQTKGVSAEEIAQRYARANIKISDRSSWFKDNYGFEAPTTITNRDAMQQWRKQAFEGNATSIFPTVPIETSSRVIPSGGNADRPLNFMQAPNGLLVRAPKTMAQPQAVTDSPYAPKVLATNEQALKGEVNWTDVSSTERERMLKDPTFYTSGQITKYPAWMQQQILTDPNFDWDRLPAWQRTYYDLSSSPAGMGAVQGGLMGLGGGGLVGAGVGSVVGSALGWAAAKSGYDQTKEFWKQDNLTAGAFGLFNFLAEQAEKTAGMGFQIANAAVDPKKNVVDVLNKESWNAGAGFFEVITPAWIEAVNTGKGEIGADDLLKVAPSIWALVKVGDLIAHPEKYKGKEVYLGAESPIQIDESWTERLDNARAEIKAGRPYREVMMDMQTGIVAQMGDMAGQAAADPLNFLPGTGNKIAGKLADLEGNKVAAAAFNSTEGVVEAGRKYRTLVQSGQALTIDPNFKMSEMSDFSRFIAGVNDQGQVKSGSLWFTKKGLLDPVTSRNKTGWLEDAVTQTPYSRAQTGAGMFYENVSAMLSMFETPKEAGKYLTALSKGDMETWAELGSRFAESAEWYTVLPALKDFATEKLAGVVQTWEMTAPNRDLLTRVADIMGDQPGNVLEDLVKRGTAEQDFQRVVKRLQESDAPTAKALLADVEAGRFTAETLKQMVDVFTGEGALPWHPGQWKALMLDQLGDHFDQWVSQRLMLDKSPEAQSAFFRTSALMKQAQSVLLLGGSPGYAITNGLSNMVHRAVSGGFGLMRGKQIDTFLDRFGITPARFDEGVGIGGVVEQASGTSKVKTSAMDKAVRGTGPLTTAKDALAKLSKGMPFSKLSSWFEKLEGRQMFSIAMRDAWSQSWRRGVGFREMSPDLVRVVNEMGVDPKQIYAAIESGMNQAEIEKALMGRQAEAQARSLIHDAAEKTGMSASEAAQMLEGIGILDTLDQFLKGQTSPDGVTQAFRRAERQAQDWMDMRTGDDLKARAENVKQRVGLEGAAAALDVAQKAHGEFTDAWMDHYYRFGEVMQNIMELDDAQRDKALDYAYDVSDKEFRRVDATNAANWQGVFEAWGLSGDPRALRMLDGMGEVGTTMSGAYRQMRENFRAWREKWASDPTNPARWDELTAVRGQNDVLFKQAFRQKHDAEVKMGAALTEIYEAQHGPAAGEAARKWWEDVVTFNDEIVKREQNFRGEMAQAARAGVPADLIAAQKQKYYSETKILLIAELEKINSEGIARLERVIRKGGGSPTSAGGPAPTGPIGGGQSAASVDVPTELPSAETVQRWQENQYAKPAQKTTPPPTPPQSESAIGEGSRVAVDPMEEVNALMAAAEQRKGREKAESETRKAAVWDVAEEYWGKGGNYNRGILQDGFALVNALRKQEYGGIPDLTWLDDPRLTPELARQILETRKAAKETSATAAAEQTFTVTEKGKVNTFDPSQINQDTTILRAVALLGGINLETAKNLTGEVKPKSAPGVFTRRGHNKGWDVSDMARMLADEGYPINLNDVNDPGGVQQTTDLINRARAGDKVYPMGHDFSAEISAAEKAWIDGFNFDEVPEIPFDSALWQTAWDNAVEYADLGRVFELIGDFPNDRLDMPAPNGERWRDYLARVSDETANRAAENTTAEAVAGHAARVDESIRAAESRAEAATKRTILMESLADAFTLSEEQVQAYGQLSDAVAGWYAKMTGETADDFYNRYFGEVRKADGTEGGGLRQEAFHGSPYKFDKFTTDRMGTGEGNQAYGWGLYFAGDKSVGEYYRQKLAGDSNQPPQRFYKGKALEPGTPEYHAATLLSRTDRSRTIGSARKEVAGWIKEYQAKLEGYKTNPDPNMPRIIKETEALIGGWQKTLDLLNEATSKKDFTEKPNAGQLYKVELPDENYLLWDKPLSEQSESVRLAIKQGYAEMAFPDPEQSATPKTGRTIYNDFKAGIGGLQTQDPKAASLYLKELGINGIQYLDGSSRNAGDGSYNYVIFDDAAVQIKETFYQREQQGGLWGAGEDMPLFSGTPQKAKAETFKPTEAGRQDAMFDMRPQFGTKEPSLAPKVDESRIPGTFDKGMVTFEDMKGTITAFEKGDFSTVVHETGHIYRRMMADVAERTGNPYILRDLKTVEEWAGVKDGQWDRAAEEKFARGFERYLADGKAPTPALVRAFEQFKNWMLDIYKTITGSQIDVKLTDEVRRVFDRMLGAENLRIDLDNMLRQMNYDPRIWYTDPQGNIVKRPKFEMNVDKAAAQAQVEAMDIESLQAQAAALRERMASGQVQPGPDAESLKNYREGWRSWSSADEPPVPTSKVRELTDWTLGKMKEQRNKQAPSTLFQSEVPFGMYDEKAQFRPGSDGMDALWREKVTPLLRAMEEGAVSQMQNLSAREGAFRDMSPEGQAMLKKYMQQVKGEMATTKLATIRFAEKQRDFALLNYSKRYGYDRMADFLASYQLYPSRSLVNWMGRAVDKPALFSNYARLRMQQDRYERDMPERLRGKIRIKAPWLPEWAGDSLYIDPLRNLFFPDTVARYLERAQQDKNYQVIEAERVLQEWQSDGQYSQSEILDAAQSQKGKVWERAWEEAQMRRESETSNPVDFFTSFFGPSWYLSTPLNLAGIQVPGISKGDPNKVNTLPLGNTARALDTVTQGTWAEPVGDLLGLIGKGEDKIRETFKLPTRGEYAEYYTKRQVANMVAEGLISPEDAQMAMIEKQGDIWAQAQQRVDMEFAMRVPLAAVTYATLQEGPAAGAQAALPSLFGASLLPAGELEYRGLKQEWNEAWKLADAGDTKAVQRFFDNYPEYEAYLAKNKDDGELLKSFMIGQIWDAYMELGNTNQKQARAELGEDFRQSFLDKETRSYETLDVNQLTEWARLLGARVPTPSGAVAPPPPTSTKLEEGKLQLYPEQVTAVTDKFFSQRTELYPNYYEEQAGYYALPKSERKAYLIDHPDLAKYWDWKDRWYGAYPQYVPIFKGDAFDRVDTSEWMPGLEDAVREAALTSGILPQGARAALMNEWMLAGQPMDNFDTWVKSVVMPGMMYGN